MTKEHALKLLELNATPDEYDLKTAYRKQAKKYHPDLASDPIRKTYCHKKFVEIHEAYKYLLEFLGSREDSRQDAKTVINEKVRSEDRKEFGEKSFINYCLDFISIVVERSMFLKILLIPIYIFLFAGILICSGCFYLYFSVLVLIMWLSIKLLSYIFSSLRRFADVFAASPYGYFENDTTQHIVTVMSGIGGLSLFIFASGHFFIKSIRGGFGLNQDTAFWFSVLVGLGIVTFLIITSMLSYYRQKRNFENLIFGINIERKLIAG
jgi:hypothetical protein